MHDCNAKFWNKQTTLFMRVGMTVLLKFHEAIFNAAGPSDCTV